MALRAYSFAATPAGSAGSATVTITTPRIKGKIHSFDLDLDTQPATTDVTFRTKGAAGRPSRNIWARSNSNADGYFVPRKEPVDAANAAITANGTNEMFAVNDLLEVVLAQGDPVTNGIRVTIYVEG